ncbi:MAG: extracellular solute-binding protein [Defluviitaleaceae bacterium]|nr:extracellular solute-binding protein [Defluviitaleaceae bacterium]
MSKKAVVRRGKYEKVKNTEIVPKIVFFSVIAAVILLFILLRGSSEVLRFRDAADLHEGFPPPEGSYAAFLDYHRSDDGTWRTHLGEARIDVDIFSPSQGVEGEDFIITDYQGYRVLRTAEDSYVEFSINVPRAGLYNLRVEYFPTPARGIDIQRELRINGELPFAGAELITLRRVWGSAGPVREDNRGNQIRPPQVELPRWERAYFIDRLGFFTDPYAFYFEAGENTISFTGVNEPLVLRSLALTPIEALPSFREFQNETPLAPNTSDFSVRVQGQHSTYRSSPSLFPIFDNSSGITDPPSVALITLNMIGGTAWRIPGQWIEWEVEVPADGLYHISLSARQSYNRGFVSARTLSINGVVPFEEVAAIPFSFNNSWELITLSDADGDKLLFPMHEGLNTIRMYVTLGEMGEMIDSLLASVHRLNAIYREIMVLTGPEPDPLRDYRVHVELPHVVQGHHVNGEWQRGMIDMEVDILYEILRDMEEYLGERNEHTGIIAALITQLDTFYARPNRIPHQLISFRQNISSFANTTRELMEGPLDIDFFIVSGTGAELPVVRETFFTRMSHEAQAFVASFTHDFDNIGDFVEGEGIDVWITHGRDQATALKSMIDDTFTPETGINVNLRLVHPGAVLPAVVAGIGPDLVVGMMMTEPAQYAFRNAAVDLSQFEGRYVGNPPRYVPGFDETFGRFHESSWVRMAFIDADGHKGFYGMPETQVFNLMFYRADILNELGFEPPQTWNDVLAMMPMLQRNNMAIGIPPIGDPMAPDIGGFMTQLYQRGGFLYVGETCERYLSEGIACGVCEICLYGPHSRAAFDTEEALEAFEAFTQFFTHFGSPEFFDPATRFRSGEMPIIFGPFTMFNLFSVFAPEISGQWNFAPMPGYDHMTPVYAPHRGGYYRVHHTVPDFGTSAIMIQQSDMQDESWEFLTWWTSAETQLRFGREMESVMGEAARYPTANTEAFQSLPWSSSQLAVLNEQRDWVLGTPEIPGGYYVFRQLVNVIRRVVNDNLDTRETLLDVQIVINRELSNKRREFGLE